MGCEASFGPKETEETLMMARMKKMNDIALTKASLDEQLMMEYQANDQFKRKKIEMEKSNISKALKVINEANSSERRKKDFMRNTLNEAWEAQGEEIQMKNNVQFEVEDQMRE
jgi:hypothetical protein